MQNLAEAGLLSQKKFHPAPILVIKKLIKFQTGKIGS